MNQGSLGLCMVNLVCGVFCGFLPQNTPTYPLCHGDSQRPHYFECEFAVAGGKICPMPEEMSQIFKITLLRHAESVGNADGYHQGYVLAICQCFR